MLVEPIYDLLGVAVPDECAHIVGARGENICMVGAEPHALHWQRVACEHHDRRLCSRAQVPHLDRVVSRCRRDKVLVFVEVEGQDLVVMSVDSLDIAPLSQVPNAHRLVATAAAKD
uniref:Uncharacterized protein n=1 Tax=Favella ehrenbergii TaxID=182087 RepID=A0A7S3MMB8_9SPIT